MADNLATLPTYIDPERLQRLLALSGNAPNGTGDALRPTPIASQKLAPIPIGDEAQQRISEGASPSSFGLHRVAGTSSENPAYKSASPQPVGSPVRPVADSARPQPISLNLRGPSQHSDLGITTAIDETNPVTTHSAESSSPEATTSRLRAVGQPEVGGQPEAPKLQPIGQPSPVKPLSFAERQDLPLVSPGTPAGSAADYQNKLERIADQKQNPWGSAENHPGFLGKLAHVGARIGNIAGDIVAPATMALIPGTDMHRDIEEGRLRRNYEGAQTREDREGAERARERETEEQRGIESRRNEVMDRRNDILEDKPPRESPNVAAMADLEKQINPETNKPYTPYEARVKVAQGIQDTKPEKTMHTSPFEAFAYGSPEEKQAAQDFLKMEKRLGAQYQKPDDVERRYALFKKDPDSYKAMYGDRGQATEDRQANTDRTHATAMLKYFQKQRDEIEKNFMLGDDEKAQKLRELDEIEKPFMETARGAGGGAGGKNDRVNVIHPDGTAGTIPRNQLKGALKKGYKQAPSQ